MPLPSYQVLMIDPTAGTVIKVLDSTSWFDLRYSRVYNGIGVLALTVPFSAVNSDMLNRTDMIIEVQRTSPVTGLLITEETYLARDWHRFKDGTDERYTFGAVSLNHLLARRIIDPADDPLVAGGYSTKASTADLVLYQYANEQCGPSCLTPSRSFPNLSIAGVPGSAPAIGLRLQYDNLFQVFQDNAKQAGIDFRIRRTSSANMQLDIGTLTTDRTYTTNSPTNPYVVLNPLRGNLSSPSLTRDRKDEANFVYMRGKGQGSSRSLLKYFNGDAMSASPFNRIEAVADARNTEKGDSLGILTEAANFLKERQQKITFSFNPEGTEPGNEYRNDWDVGDKVTAEWDSDRFDVRILSVSMQVTGGGESLSITTEVQ